MSFNGARIYEAKVLVSNPAMHTVRVALSTSSFTDSVECAILMPHGSGNGDSHMVSMPVVGQMVLVLLDSSETNGVVLGTLPKASMGGEAGESLSQYDTLSSRIRDTNYRGDDYEDILPGDLSLRSGSSRVLLSDLEVGLSSGPAQLELSSVMGGHSHLHTQADTVTHSNSLFKYSVQDGGDNTLPSFLLGATTQNLADRTSIGNQYLDSQVLDTLIQMNSDTPFSLSYRDSAEVSVDARGNLLLKGARVRVETDGQVHEWGEGVGLSTTYSDSISLGSDKSVAITSGGGAKFSGASVSLVGDNSMSISATSGTVGIVAGGVTKSIPLPGLDTVLGLQAPNGGVEIKAGSYVPGPGSLTKPGVRIQSDGGGDIHISSTPSPGGLFTTGSIVLDSALPLSSAVSGGLGNYGIVLNSPLVHIGGIPGVADTPAGLPGPYGPPIPPVYDSYVKHFPFMTTYNAALVAGIGAALAASFPPTAKVSVPLFTGIVSTSLATMASPPVGRPLTMVGIG